MTYGVFLEGANTAGRKAMPCGECSHLDEDRFCDITQDKIKRRPFYCIHFDPK